MKDPTATRRRACRFNLEPCCRSGSGQSLTGVDAPADACPCGGPARLRRRILTVVRLAWLSCILALCPLALAAGTGAGIAIPNSVTLDYTQGGVDRRAAALSTFYVDELLEVSVRNIDASSIGVLAAQLGATQQYTVTNLGNGRETFLLSAEPGVAGDDFDAVLDAIYLETNGTPGLQTGPGGDDLYIAGTNDPSLSPDETLSVYVTADIPPGVVVGAVALLELRAIATTIVQGSGTSDPVQPSFPTVGENYPGLGDAENGGANTVDAMVGVSYDATNPLYADRHDYLVNDVGVAITKTAYQVADPSGGNAVVPGSVISYRVLVELVGGGAAQALVVTDPLPVDLRYFPNSLSVVGLPSGENADDDLVPAGVDNTGINGNTVEVSFGDVAGPVSLTIEYQAIVQ